MYYTPPWVRVQTIFFYKFEYGCRLNFFINLMVLGFDLVVLGLKKRVLGFEKRVLGLQKNGTPLKQKNKNPLKIP